MTEPSYEGSNIRPFRRLEKPPLSATGGGGTSDGMEGRVAKLEAHMETVRADVGQLKTDMRDIRDRMKSLEVKVDHLPSKGFIVVATSTGLALVGAIMTAVTVYQAKLQALLGVVTR